jgi:hypothetical protein|tara:strand:+ start:3460 stop:3651 length:192 start_codon:yes stop_codon:yes gene_type:complete
MTVQMPDLAVNCTQLTIAEEVHTSPFEADEHERPQAAVRPLTVMLQLQPAQPTCAAMAQSGLV